MLRATRRLCRPQASLLLSTSTLARGMASSAADKPFDKVLIANRGEIACRVMRTCKNLGVKTVAIYSDADVRSKHVMMADEAYRVGAAPTSESYLQMDTIMEVIKKSGAQAVHPGYGFLSENTKFSALCEKNGVAFVGPDAFSIDAMGDKIHSKELAIKAGVSCIPGFDGEVESAEQAVELAQEIGYPVMIKASAGGGGKGMRVAYNAKELADGYRMSKDEARSSFGDDRMLIEKFIENPHHIEIQVLGDTHGNVIAFPERECSVQRRNQKVIEESPSCLLLPETRAAMQEQAIQLAKAVEYKSAGTVEMLCDEKQNFYFLEMNTRLQVEHPITEYVSGEDLVEHMLWIAAGKALPDRLVKQGKIAYNGHSIESRVYAEDPIRGFLPSIGPLTTYKEPEIHLDNSDKPLVRIDTGVFEGGEISMYYDPLISKLITYGEDRDKALHNMERALDGYYIQGLGNNLTFLRDLTRNEVFRSGNYSTKIIEEQWPEGFHGVQLSQQEVHELVATTAIMHSTRLDLASELSGRHESALPLDSSEFMVVLENGQGPAYHVEVVGGEEGVEVHIEGPNGESHVVKFQDLEWIAESHIARVVVAGEERIVQYRGRSIEGYSLRYNGSDQELVVRTPAEQEYSKHMLPPEKHDFSKVLLCPMPGTLVSVAVADGQHVEEGQELAVVEAMKMQNILRASKTGTVKKVNCKAGDRLKVDQIILEFDE